MKTKKLLFGLGLALLGSFAQAQNGLDSIIVETYYISNAADAAGSVGTLPIGSVTYRIYAEMKPGYKFEALFGIPNHVLKLATTTTFFNNEDRGDTSPTGISLVNTKKNTVMLDSWFSAGGTAAGKVGVLKSEDTDGSVGNTDGILQNADPLAGPGINTKDGMIAGTPGDVTFVGLTTELDVFNATSQVGNLFSTTNGSVASLNGTVGPTATNRVLVGQFTTDGQFSYELNIQIGTPTGGYEQYVAKNATGNQILNTTLMGTAIVGSSTGVKENKDVDSSIRLYPNPATDFVTLQISSTSKQNNSYTIYGVQGNEILSKKLGTLTENQTENIDLSSLGTGMYFIKLSIDGVITTKKIIKN